MSTELSKERQGSVEQLFRDGGMPEECINMLFKGIISLPTAIVEDHPIPYKIVSAREEQNISEIWERMSQLAKDNYIELKLPKG